MADPLRIACASGFWGDSAGAVPQLLRVPGLQVIACEYLAETTMAVLSRARQKDPSRGYAADFVDVVVARHLPELTARGIRLVTNAGGLNLPACRDAVAAAAARHGHSPRIAIVEGDDLMPQEAALRAEGALPRETEGRVLSLNAYLGARPVAAACAAGADIVITGRGVDSALALGPLAAHFGWRWDDWDRIAAGTLAGHVIECGAQATGGIFTDWAEVPGWEDIGYPVLDVFEDGSFELFKPDATGGLIAPLPVSEQILYEVADPGSYVMPDVTCDFTAVSVVPAGPGRVRVSGARGRPPTATLKAVGTARGGFQVQLMLAIRGIAAPAKARRTADALLARARRMMTEAGFADFAAVQVDLLGCESHYGPHARNLPMREVVLRIAARHADTKALTILQRECASAGTSFAPGTRSTFFGRADIAPVVVAFTALIGKDRLQPRVTLGDAAPEIPPAPPVTIDAPGSTATDPPPCPIADEPLVEVPLVRLAVARSGDKGDDVNIGVIARDPAHYPWLRATLTQERVAAQFAHLLAGDVERFEAPGLHALNFVLHHALAGGGAASLRSDPLGKAFAQILLDLPLPVPASWVQPECEYAIEGARP